LRSSAGLRGTITWFFTEQAYEEQSLPGTHG
jgi:hypothetical protein